MEYHRHLSNIDCLMARTAGLVCLISSVSGCCKKKKNALEDVAQVAGTQQNLSNLYSLDIYEPILYLKASQNQTCVVLHTEVDSQPCPANIGLG
jgi:hypothetical protein